MALYNDITQKPFFIVGPCVMENQELLYTVAEKVAEIGAKYPVTVVFKSSFDKANRTSVSAYRGPGLAKGMEMLNKVKEKFNLPVTTDIHEPFQAAACAEVVDILQIPAFLCRQTDLLVAAAETGKIVNVKKAQFLSGQDMFYPTQKVKESGNDQIILTERGNSFGYNNLVVDFRNVADMLEFGYPVCMDCTHSVQRPGGAGGKTGGDRKFVPGMAHAAKAFGASGYFIETHTDPDHAMSDGPNMLYLKDLEELIKSLIN
ncbi:MULTISPECIES: 3-deoxy-8-phosphooctulonate synthase [unclassified Mucilaginibacter]|uniref:3-deoxy-8-phosphooctulonate synthase n=1 Tax=unclassified Mucilaginibacter TaxID=2617802 RepID=UPI002AC8E10B|nr:MULTISPECIES: 3-deoxy-8-phosphooctulonate synthase [unclassified Mucilaginibacter]MEB0262965.1 3-deoxy-8-phosphooctulonate synthase [Mucilaginibacter sp. 10I4]MEB0277540.1 3-deoxy-8-phosphooctulonate synthase [Mucilaginibacter sp. 10B2]MEB0299455.1 3-deoxy-8-phosphooctulonate synthase [Mucilaginibacter sp. 5C4]WPX24830.1 3-deoxy-8-phosphooctulonate synthase [Mucilaginibacter sp. 5C4]